MTGLLGPLSSPGPGQGLGTASLPALRLSDFSLALGECATVTLPTAGYRAAPSSEVRGPGTETRSRSWAVWRAGDSGPGAGGPQGFRPSHRPCNVTSHA